MLSIMLHNSYALPAIGFPIGQLIMIRLADADRGSRRAGRAPFSSGWDPMASRIPEDCPIANLPLFMRPCIRARDFHSTGASRPGPTPGSGYCSAVGVTIRTVMYGVRIVGSTLLAVPELSTHSSMYLAYRLQHRDTVHVRRVSKK
ncbi:hypothetical protein CGRA01v4_05421 [Colletotrichum graminicola]|nr:hypothetical protein CGRA01v4_05421 [Colletotrichum graminicola]